MVKSTESLGSAIWAAEPSDILEERSGISSPAFQRRGASLTHSLGVARFRSCSHQPPSTRARDLSGGPVLASSWDCPVLLLVSSATEKSQSFSTPPPYVRLTLSHYQSSSLTSLSIKVICTQHLALEQLPPPRALLHGRHAYSCLLTAHPPLVFGPLTNVTGFSFGRDRDGMN